ncbi:MAG: PAS domain S-box protein [Candidatus Bathyarchaeota archaeon]|nr:PAS domain S-box protein [Candidatus Bathyarchaeota archaeon]
MPQIDNASDGLLDTSKNKFLSQLSANMTNGFAYHKIIFDAESKPVDYVFLEINQAFEQITGLKREKLVGKKATNALPNVENSSAKWINVYGKVALTGITAKFKSYSQLTDKWFAVSAFSPEKGYVAATFATITDNEKNQSTLKKSQRLLAAIVDSIADGFYSLDHEFRFQHINDAALVHFGKNRKDMLGLSLFEVFPMVKNSIFEAQLQQAVQSGQPVNFEFSSMISDKDMEVHIYPSDESITVLFLYITEQKKDEESLRRLNRHLSVISNSNQALMHANNENMYAQEVCDNIINDCGYALVWMGVAGLEKTRTLRPIAYAGSDKEYLKGLNIVWSENTANIQEPIGTVIQTGKPHLCRDMKNDPKFEPWREEVIKRGYTASLTLPLKSFEDQTFGVLSIYSKDNDPFSEDEIGLLTELANDFAYGIMMIHLRREKERTNKLMHEQAVLLDLSPDAIIMRTIDGTISFWSTGAEKLYRWTKEEVIGQNIQAILQTKFPENLESITSKLKEKGHWSGEIIHHTKDGHEIVLQSYWLAKFDKNGNVLEMMESNVDVTDRKQMQTKLEEYTAHLEELVQERTKQLKDAERLAAIGETAGMVGHDLRNPLQTVTGETFLATEELKQMPDSPAKRNLEESVSIIAEQIGYMDKIVSDLQDFVRPITPDKKQINLQTILLTTLARVSLPVNVKAQTQIAQDLPEILADSQLLKRVFYNLFTNAVQAMPEGGELAVKAYLNRLPDGKSKVIVHVDDTGVGIPENIKPKIFRPLFTTKSKGQGFGLAVCRRVIEAHGGTIKFRSQEGKGTRFTVKLPAA